MKSVLAYCISAPRWWHSKLSAILSERLWWPVLRRREIVGILQTTHFALLETSGKRERQLLRISSDAAEFDADFNAALSNIKRRGLPMTLRLSSELGLRKIVNLPFAAKNDLEQLLSFEMDRLSPFTADEIYFAHRIVKTIDKKRSILVEVHIVPRMVVERALATCKYLGLDPNHLELVGADGDADLNLLPRDVVRSRSTSRMDWALAGTAVALAGLIVVAPLQQQRNIAADLERQIMLERDAATESLALRQQLETLTAKLSRILNRNQSAPRLTRLIAELTGIIEDDAYLVQLRIDEQEMVVRGYGRSASELIVRLEESHLFSGTRFLSPITRDLHKDRDHFQIWVGLRERSG